MGFSAIDYVVLLVYLVGITIFGTLFRKSHRSVKDYFVGTKKTHWFVISLSIVATETSTLTLIGVPALAYSTYARPEQGGALTYLQVVAGYVVARVIISFLFIPAYFQGELLTAYELLSRRFGSATKHFAASLFLTMRALAEGVRVFAASLVLAAVIGASLPGLPHLWLWSIILVGLLTLVYTFEGGIAAVIWTDLIQLVIYIGGSLLAAWQLLHMVPGGWPAIAAQADAAHKFEWLSFSWDLDAPVHVLGGPDRRHVPDDGLSRHRSAARAAAADLQDPARQPEGADHQRVHRAVPVRPVPHDRRDALCLLPARAAAAAHEQRRDLPGLHRALPASRHRRPGHCRRLRGGDVEPERVAELAGFDDRPRLLQADRRRRRTDAQLLRLSRWCTAAWGVVLIGIAVVARGWGSVFTAGLSIASLVYGPMLGAFLLGVLTKRANQPGVMAGIAASLGSMLLVKACTPLAWTWYVLVGTVICVTVGYTVSLAVPAGRRRVGE